MRKVYKLDKLEDLSDKIVNLYCEKLENIYNYIK